TAGMPLGPAQRARVERRPTSDFYAYTLLGRALSAALGTEGAVDLDRAHKNAQKAVYIDPKLAEGQRVLAEVLRAQGKHGKARGRLAYALSLRGDYAPALIAAAALARQESKLDRAQEL